ncbi:MAG: PD-(D/E)XK nuclease family protein, partial [Lachnospiraceae bacterium]|nr:PD-(D/E)XK nuclease family protein [Lachnospiraceae bacterium]
LCRIMGSHDDGSTLDAILNMSCAHYTHTPLSDSIAEGIYGTVMQTSVSRLERFAACAYAHFLSYGLRLRERPEYSFENNDMGDVYHKALEEFSNRVSESGAGWNGLGSEEAAAWADEIMDRLINTYGDTILISNNRNIAMSDRLKRIVRRSVDTIRYQVGAGDFIPKFFERGFSESRSFTGEDGAEHTYRLTGKIDRVDICESNENRYLRIVDYKSGNRDFDIAALYHGLMMQLAVYMDAALKITGDTQPAGMLYYHMSDPVVSADADTTDEEAADLVRGELRMKGVVNSDPDIARLMDRTLTAGTGSKVIPLAYKKDNTPQAYSKAYTTDELKLMLEYTEKKMDELSSRIMGGCIEVHPAYMKRSDPPCRWCDYASVCHIASGIPGYERSEYDDDPADIPEAMRRSVKAQKDNNG